jgi:hypothetical protein
LTRLRAARFGLAKIYGWFCKNQGGDDKKNTATPSNNARRTQPIVILSKIR